MPVRSAISGVLASQSSVTRRGTVLPTYVVRHCMLQSPTRRTPWVAMCNDCSVEILLALDHQSNLASAKPPSVSESWAYQSERCFNSDFLMIYPSVVFFF